LGCRDLFIQEQPLNGIDFWRGDVEAKKQKKEFIPISFFSNVKLTERNLKHQEALLQKIVLQKNGKEEKLFFFYIKEN
jgi:hypothetical protein